MPVTSKWGLCVLLAWLVGLACGACAGTEAEADPQDGLAREAEQSGDAGGSDLAGPEVPTVADRCFTGHCERARLPKLPELEFLGDVGDGYLRLIEADWELAANSEGYRCMRLTVPETIHVSAMRPLNPPGTHHVALFLLDEPTGPDGVQQCDSAASGARRLGGSGVATEPYAFPEGTAVRVQAGGQLLLHLHLFNNEDVPIRGRSGVWVKTLPAADVEDEVEITLAGTINLQVPPGRSTTTATCGVPADTNLFSIAPHMHQLGSHMRVRLGTGGRTPSEDGKVLLDSDYDFYEQEVQRIDPVLLKAGDRFTIECTYDNDTGHTVLSGDGSRDEMCFAVLSVYPPVGYGALDFCQ